MEMTVFSPAERTTLAVALYGARSRERLISVDLVRADSMVADGASIYLLDGKFIMLLSAKAFPGSMADQAFAMREMARRLGEDAGSPILNICAEGSFESRSYLVLPRCRPLSSKRIIGRIDSWKIRPKVLRWLRLMASLVEQPNTPAIDEFVHSLTGLRQTFGLPDVMAQSADQYIRQLKSGGLRVGHVPMHGDLWKGNLLQQEDHSLAVIDWGGSTPSGYGLYDLIRAADSLSIPTAILRREIAWHIEILGSGADGGRLHLLAGLGHYANRLGEFPREKFIMLATNCFATLNRVS